MQLLRLGWLRLVDLGGNPLDPYQTYTQRLDILVWNTPQSHVFATPADVPR